MIDVLNALRDVLPVNPWLAGLWWLSALALGAVIVCAWRRVFG